MNRWILQTFLCFFLCLPATRAFGAALPLSMPHLRLQLISDAAVFVPGNEIRIGVHFEPEPQWHVYWINPGDSGEPPQIHFQLPERAEAGPLQWPVPKRIPVGPLFNYGYDEATLIYSTLSIPASHNSPLNLKADVQWLICKEECIPGKATLDLSLNPGPQPKPSAQVSHFAAALERTPQLDRETEATLKIEEATVELRIQSTRDFSGLAVFPVQEGPFGTQQQIEKTDNGVLVRLEKNRSKTELENPQSFVLTYDGGHALVQAHLNAPTFGMGLSLLYAFLGGLLLNLMPCVFPILFLKAMQLLEGKSRESKTHGLWYLLGVVLSFLLLGSIIYFFRSAGHAVGWGFQLQSPTFVAILSFLFLVLALNLIGLFEINPYLPQWGQSATKAQGAVGALATGFLATVVATPCTAPFMGSALGYTLTRPPVESLLIFAALGFGMGVPFTALSLWPRLAAWLPKPGKWMVKVRELFSFALLGSALWLISIFSEQTGAGLYLMFGHLGIALALWMVKEFPRFRLSWVLAGFLLVVSILLPLSSTPDEHSESETWQPFSEVNLQAALQQKQAVFINFTAQWCITCQVNERLVFSDEALMESLAAGGVLFLEADWTSRDKTISRYLEKYGRLGVPLYVYYPPGKPAQILPQILTKSLLKELPLH